MSIKSNDRPKTAGKSFLNKLENEQKKKEPEAISPELAAMVVKKYIIPMFESNNSKEVK